MPSSNRESRLPETSADTGVRGPSRSTNSLVDEGALGAMPPWADEGRVASEILLERYRSALEQLDGNVGRHEQAIITQTLRPPAPADQQGAG